MTRKGIRRWCCSSPLVRLPSDIISCLFSDLLSHFINQAMWYKKMFCAKERPCTNFYTASHGSELKGGWNNITTFTKVVFPNQSCYIVSSPLRVLAIIKVVTLFQFSLQFWVFTKVVTLFHSLFSSEQWERLFNIFLYPMVYELSIQPFLYFQSILYTAPLWWLLQSLFHPLCTEKAPSSPVDLCWALSMKIIPF